MCVLCRYYRSVLWIVHIYVLDESLSYPVSILFQTILNSLQFIPSYSFIYVSHGPNEDYYATENCLITQGDKKYICQKKTENITHV